MQQAAKFVITLRGNEIKKFAFPKGKKANAILGKNKSQADIFIDSRYVSGTHLELIKDANDNLFVKDLNSTNGTYVNNRKISAGQVVPIKINDIISFTEGSDIQLLILAGQYSTSAAPSGISQNNIARNLDQKSEIVIGRGSSCDIVLNAQMVSRKHAILLKNTDGTYTIRDNYSSNGTYINNSLLTGSRIISSSDLIKIGNQTFSLSDFIGGTASTAMKTPDNSTSIAELLKNKNTIVIGRNKEADITINDNMVSREHTRVTKDGGKYFVQDLGSTNGTFINNTKVKSRQELKPSDELRIGLRVFGLDQAERELSDETAIRASSVTKKYPNGYVGLKPMDVNIPSKAFIALMGPSGCGKTTLMNTLNGDNPSTGGRVLIHGLELKQNYQTLKQKIGYVPQDDIVHKDLTVDSSLYYAAKLRMNTDTTEQEISERIEEVLTSLKINRADIRSKRIGSLSGGQRKRVSIAVELLNKPAILFLDEPTSPLDPETIDGFLTSIKNLTVTENTTVVMVTHKPSDLAYVDRVIFLGTEGHQAFYGSETEMYPHFGLPDKNIIGVYSLLSTKEKAEEWGRKWKSQVASEAVEVKEKKGFEKESQKVSWFSQLFWLTKRYANIKLNDRGNMVLLMAQPIVIPLALIYLFDKLQLGVLFMMAVSAIWFGVSNAAKEIVGEIPIYKRERMFNLNITTYILSKIGVLSVIALIQVTIFILIISVRFSGDENGIELVNMPMATAFMFLLAFSATLLGLLLSVIFDNAEKVMTFIPIILIPQIIFSGVIADIDTQDKELASYTMLGRWGTEGLARIQSIDEDGDPTKGYMITEMDTIIVNIKGKYDSIPEIIKVINPIAKTAKFKWKRVNKTRKDTIIRDSVIRSVYSLIPQIKSATDTALIKPKAVISEKDSVIGDTIPYTYQGESKFETSDPLKSLKFYELKDDEGKPKLFNTFNSLNKNILAISLINLLVLISIYIGLKKKDSL